MNKMNKKEQRSSRRHKKKTIDNGIPHKETDQTVNVENIADPT